MENYNSMRKYALATMVAAASFFIAGCMIGNNSPAVAEFKGGKVLLSEYESAYNKNTNSNIKNDSGDVQKNFLDLYVNFRLKLADATERGYNSNPELQNELLDYKKKIGVTYILEKNLVEPNVRRLWELRKKEYRISHIMFRGDSTGEEGARAKANAVLDSITRFGKSFEEMAKKYSSDNFSAKNGGDVYYFTPGLLRAPEFEEAYIQTKVGDVYPHVVKTQFGLHIIKVKEIRERIPSVRVSHIMINLVDENGKEDSARARAKADSVYQEVMKGGDFAELAKKYSQDHSTRDNGGDLNFFERRMMVPEFDEAAYNLKIGEVSKIVKTVYGYHIIKQTDRKPYPGFEEDKENIKLSYKMYRYNNDYDTMTASLKKKFSYAENKANLELLAAGHDSTKISYDNVKAPWYETIKSTPLFTMGGKTLIIDSLMNYMLASSEFNGRMMEKKTLESALKKYSDDMAVELQALQLDKENTEFASLMDDYRNGIFIFRLQEDEVWNQIKIDSTKLAIHWDKYKQKFRWQDRVEFGEIFSRSDSLIKVYADKLKKGVVFDTLAASATERAGFREKAGRYALTEVSSSDLAGEANKLSAPGDVSSAFANAGGFSLIKLYAKDPARMKTFEEAKAEVSGSFQEEEAQRLEKAYVQRLKDKYQPKYFYDALPKTGK